MKRAALAAILVALAIPPTADAANPCDAGIVDKTWTPTSGANWFTAANWSPAGVPTQSDDVCIPDVAPNTPTFAAAHPEIAVASLESFKQITFNGTLHLYSTTQASILRGRLTLSPGAILENAYDLNVRGELTWNNSSTITGPGTITADGKFSVPATAEVTLDDATLKFDGVGSFEAGADTLLAGDAVLEIGPSGVLDIKGDRDIVTSGSSGTPLLHNSGEIYKSTSATSSTFDVPFENDALIFARDGTNVTLTGDDAGHESHGLFFAGTGATIEFDHAEQHFAGGMIAGPGSVVADHSNLYIQPLRQWRVASGGTLVLGDSSVLSNAGDLFVDGHLDWNATIVGSGLIDVTGGGTLTGGGPGTQRVLSGGVLDINGTATLAGGVSNTGLLDATIEVHANGVLKLGDGQSINPEPGAVNNAIELRPLSTLRKDSGSGTATISTPVVSDGAVEVLGGRLDLLGPFPRYEGDTGTLVGTYSLFNGSKLRINDADVVTLEAAITLDGPGAALEDETGADGLRDLARLGYAGQLRLRSGRNFTRSGSLANDGLIDLAASTILTTTGDYVQSEFGDFRTEIAGPTAGSGYGRLAVGGTATLNGTLTADASYIPQASDIFDVVTGTRSGTFASVTAPGFDVAYLASRVRLTAPTLGVADTSIGEGDSGTANAQFSVQLPSAAAGTVTVDYHTVDATAKSPGDYAAQSGTLTFAPGVTTQPIDVPVAGDTLDEPGERFSVVLSNPVGARVGDGTGSATILDDDAPPALSIADAAARPEGGGQLVFTVSLSAPSGRRVTVAYSTADGTASAPVDYTSKSGTVSFAPGQTTKSVSVASVEDSLDEAGETVAVGLSSPAEATIADGTAVGTITDDDPPPAVTVADAAARPEGGTPLVFKVSLSAPSGQTVTVAYSTADWSAHAPGDYRSRSGTLTFTPGQATKNVSVASVQDSLSEADEKFRLRASTPVNATIADSLGIGRILDDD